MVPKEDLWFFIKRAIINADGDRSPVGHPFRTRLEIVDAPFIERHHRRP
jgi:hypothetical protein